jgi:hypothetical protein
MWYVREGWSEQTGLHGDTGDYNMDDQLVSFLYGTMIILSMLLS